MKSQNNIAIHELFETDERTIFLERLEILKNCAHKYDGEMPGVRFGHTLSELLNNIWDGSQLR